MSKLDKIKEKIAALKRKASNKAATEAEAFEAMAFANKLEERYGVTVDDFEQNSEELNRYHAREEFSAHRSLNPIDLLLARDIADFTVCRCWRIHPKHDTDPHKIGFFGHEVDVELAYYIRSVCIEALEESWRVHKRIILADNPNAHMGRERQSFVLGFVDALRDKMKQYQRQRKREAKKNSSGTDLIVLKNQLLQTKFDEFGLKLGKSKGKGTFHTLSQESYGSGKQAGSSVDLGRPVGKSGGPLRIGKN
jgi:hypothetical protein